MMSPDGPICISFSVQNYYNLKLQKVYPMNQIVAQNCEIIYFLL